METAIGLLLVILAGLGTGTSAWPFKKIKAIHFEQYLFVSMFTALIIYPWIVVLLFVPDPLMVISSVGLRTLLISNIFSMSWGIANILFMVCVLKIGVSLAGAVLTALGMSVGIVTPMIFKGSGLFSNAPSLLSNAGILIFTGLFIVVVGLILVSIAGFGREKALNFKDRNKIRQLSGGFQEGLVLVVLAGILSCGLLLAFVYSQGPVIEIVKQQGAGEITSNFTVWALGTFGGALVNILYAAYLMTKKRTWKLLFIRKDELLCGTLVGFQFIVSMVLLGRGMVLLGVLGASVGFGIQQSLQIIGTQLVGFVGGEWKGIIGMPRKTLYLGLFTILIAVVAFAYSNSIV